MWRIYIYRVFKNRPFKVKSTSFNTFILWYIKNNLSNSSFQWDITSTKIFLFVIKDYVAVRQDIARKRCSCSNVFNPGISKKIDWARCSNCRSWVKTADIIYLKDFLKVFVKVKYKIKCMKFTKIKNMLKFYICKCYGICLDTKAKYIINYLNGFRGTRDN